MKRVKKVQENLKLLIQGKDNINNKFQDNINNDIQKKPININTQQNQFNDDEEFYGENPNDFNSQPNKNIKNNDESSKIEKIFVI